MKQSSTKLYKALQNSKYLLVFVLVLTLSNCQLEEEILNQENHTSAIQYKESIFSFLDDLKKGSNKEQLSKIEDLVASINVNNLKMYDLKSTEKLIVADLKSLKGFETSDKTKAIFFVYDNKITRSNIVTFHNKVPFDNYDRAIRSVFDMKKNKDNYTGKVSFYNPIQNIVLFDEFENGKLTVNGIARRKTTKKITGKTTGCTDWYLITTYSNGTQTEAYLYTTCSAEECQYNRMNGTKCGGGGGGGTGSSSSTGGVVYPTHPIDNELIVYVDRDGELIERKYNSTLGVWELTKITLSEVVITNNKDNYPNLVFEWPKFDHIIVQEVLGELFIFTYDGGSGGWTGVPATDELIAEAIEEQIKDSLDPCPKAVLDKLKNATKTDIAKMISLFGQPGSIFNINIIPGVTKPNNFAETSKVNGSELDINIILNKDYIDGTDYSSRPTDLSIATTLTHEIIHAYLINITSEFSAGCGLTICDFPTIYDAYVTYQATKNTSILPDAHEELIATKYVNTIAETVQEFHTGKPVAAGMATQVYTDLAMSGLYGTKYFNKKYPNDPNDRLYNDRQRIIKRIHAERSGANFGEITLAGTPCNK